jgi:ribosomal protein L11 methyltransferase
LKPGDWFDSLRKHFGILEIGEKFIIKPSWINQALPDSSLCVIELDPGAAFGTGLHPTTRMCLLKLDRHIRSGIAVLDLGTGSGILSIAAAKLGAGSVTALDIDPVAVRAATANIELNKVDKNVQVKRGTLSINRVKQYRDKFDLVLTNISSKVISDLATHLREILKSGGILIATGFHSRGMDEVLISLALADFKILDIDQDGEWKTVIASKQ